MGVETRDVDESLYSILTMINNGTWQIIQRFPLHHQHLNIFFGRMHGSTTMLKLIIEQE